MLAGLVVLTVLAVTVHGHSYHLGACPSVEPFPDFDMSKFLGKWYVIQKSSKKIRCLTYNFGASSDPHKIILEQTSEHSTLRMFNLGNKYRFSGDLTVPSPETPAKMLAKLPLGAGSASYTVFDTDYVTYGAIFACQNILGLGNRQAATIISRHPTLDETYLNKIKSKLTAFGIDTSELNVIDQNNCHGDVTPKVEINVEDENIGGVIRKGGEKQPGGNRVEVVTEEANGDEEVTEEANKFNSDIDIRSTFNRDREEVIENQNQSNNEVEWLP